MAAKGDRNAKEALKTGYYSIVSKDLKRPDCGVMIKLTIFLCKQFTPFLLKMQREAPQISSLYEDCCLLVQKLLGLFIKEEKVPKEGRALSKLNVSKDHLDCPKMNEVTADIFNLLPQKRQDKLKEEMRDTLITIVTYLQNNLALLTLSFVRSLQVLDPKRRQALSDRGKANIIKAAQTGQHGQQHHLLATKSTRGKQRLV